MSAALCVAAVAAALVPIEPGVLHLAVVVALLVAAGAVSLSRRPLSGGWRLDPSGISLLAAGRRERVVAREEISELWLCEPPGAVVAADSAGQALHTAILDEVGSLLAVLLSARAQGLTVRHLVPDRQRGPGHFVPGTGASALWQTTLAADAALLHGLTDALPPSRPAQPETFRHPRDPQVAQALALRVVGVVLGAGGLVMLLAPAVSGQLSSRIWAGLGGVLLLRCLMSLRRGRAIRPSLSWRVADDELVVEHAGVSSWSLRPSDVGALALVPSTFLTRSGQIQRGRGLLVVDPAQRPIAELPLGELDPVLVSASLRRHGFVCVDPSAPRISRAPGDDAWSGSPVPPPAWLTSRHPSSSWDSRAHADMAPSAPPSADVRQAEPTYPPPPGGYPALVELRDSIGTTLQVAGCASLVVLGLGALLTWRAVTATGGTDWRLVVAVSVVCAALAFVATSRRPRLRVSAQEVVLLSAGGRTQWTVHRGDIAAVGWELENNVSHLAFLTADGVVARRCVAPGERADVDRALTARGWPLAGPVRRQVMGE